MPQLDTSLVLTFVADMPMQVLLAPAMLVGIFLIHFSYYRLAIATDGQQVIEIDDLTNIITNPGGHSVVDADNIEFCAIEGTATSCHLPLAAATVIRVLPPSVKQHFAESLTVRDEDVLDTIICGEDLTADGITTFHAPVKVRGDLIIRGSVTFEQPVVVNGVLKVEGRAHFSRGLVAKDDALVTGDITIGTRKNKGWAVFRQLTMQTRLRLNGQIISDQEFALPKAA